MRNILFSAAIILISQCALLAQKTSTWKGGTPGKANDWNCPANWSDGRVPNEFSDVIIPNLSSETYPVINKNVEDINALCLMSAASLRVEKKASLKVYDRVEVAAGAKLVNLGRLDLPLSEISSRQNTTTLLLSQNTAKQ